MIKVSERRSAVRRAVLTKSAEDPDPKYLGLGQKYLGNAGGKFYDDTFGQHALPAYGGTMGLVGGLLTSGLHLALSPEARKNKLRTLLLHLGLGGLLGAGLGYYGKRTLAGDYGNGPQDTAQSITGYLDSAGKSVSEAFSTDQKSKSGQGGGAGGKGSSDNKQTSK